MLANVDARDGGADGPEEGADTLRGVRLEVPQVHLRRAAPQKQVDTRLRPPAAGPSGFGGGEKVRQSEGAQAELAQAEHGVAAVEHERAPRVGWDDMQGIPPAGR